MDDGSLQDNGIVTIHRESRNIYAMRQLQWRMSRGCERENFSPRQVVKLNGRIL